MAEVLAAGLVVEVGEQVRGDRRGAGRGENVRFEEPRGAAVAVAEGADPEDVDVCDQGADGRLAELAVRA